MSISWPIIYSDASTSWSTTPDPPSSETLLTVAASLEIGGLLEANGQIVFGKFCGQKLCVVPSTYLKDIAGASKALRRVALQELRRRVALERLTK